jgi:DNA-binding NarL/FixJ family response regulator
VAIGNPIRLLLVEDHSLIGEELRILLQTYPNIDIVGRAQDGEEAVLAAAKLQPTAIVMDVNLPKMDGIAATREIKKKYPHIVVIGLTVATEDYILYAMRKAGAVEVLAKDRVTYDLYSAIQRAVASTHPIVIPESQHATPSTPPSTAESSLLLSTPLQPSAESPPTSDAPDE